MEIKIEKRKKTGRTVAVTIGDSMYIEFTKKCKEIGSDKSKVIRALIEAWVKDS